MILLEFLSEVLLLALEAFVRWAQLRVLRQRPGLRQVTALREVLLARGAATHFHSFPFIFNQILIIFNHSFTYIH